MPLKFSCMGELLEQVLCDPWKIRMRIHLLQKQVKTTILFISFPLSISVDLYLVHLYIKPPFRISCNCHSWYFQWCYNGFCMLESTPVNTLPWAAPQSRAVTPLPTTRISTFPSNPSYIALNSLTFPYYPSYNCLFFNIFLWFVI